MTSTYVINKLHYLSYVGMIEDCQIVSLMRVFGYASSIKHVTFHL